MLALVFIEIVLVFLLVPLGTAPNQRDAKAHRGHAKQSTYFAHSFLLPDNPDSKVNVCVKNVFAIWDKTKENRSTQLLFSDMSTPKGDGEFNIYDDIREKLVAMGIPKEEIAFIHEAED